MARATEALGSRHLLLLGLPGSGKSTIGPLVAARLGRPFVDLDAEIERREGRSVAEVFATSGEAQFRAMERAISDEMLASGVAPMVLSPGGGWIEDPANRARIGDHAFAVYLRVETAVAIRRMGPATEARPLLAGPDPEAKLTELLARREQFYLQSQYTVSTDSMTPEQAASSIVALAMAESRD